MARGLHAGFDHRPLIMTPRRSSTQCRLVSRVPQESAIYRLIFNLFTSKYPDSTRLYAEYADGMHAAYSSVNPQTDAADLSAHTAIVGHFTRDRELQTSAPKSHVTLSTLYSPQFHLHPSVTLDHSALSLERSLRF